MKRAVLLGLVLAVMCGGAASGDEGRPMRDWGAFRLGVVGAYWHAKDAGDFDGSGLFGGSVVAEYKTGTPLAAQVRMGGFGAVASEDYVVADYGWVESEASLAVLPLEAALLGVFGVGESIELYGGGGVGAYFFDGEVEVKQGPWRQSMDVRVRDRAGYFALVGARWVLAHNIRIFAEMKYMFLDTSVKNTLPEEWMDRYYPGSPWKQKMNLDGAGVQLGLMFSF